MTAIALTRSPVHAVTSAGTILALLTPFASAAVAQESEERTDPFVEFAWQIEDTIAESDAAFMNENFDLDEFFGLVTAGTDDGPFRRDFIAGARENFAFADPIVVSNSQYDGTYRFLRMMPDEPTRALFRLAGDDGLNYHELFLRRQEDGSIRIVDILPYVTGERVSSTIRSAYLAALATQNRSLVDRLLRREQYTLEDFMRIDEMRVKLASDPEGALEIYEALPESLRNQTIVQTLRLEVAAAVSDEAYLAAMTEFRSLHPDSTALALILIDYHLLRDEHAEAIATIDRIDEMVLGDPYLDIVRSRVHLLAGRPNEAREAAERSLHRDPTLDYEAAWLLLDIALTTDDHAATLALLISLEQDYGIEWSDLATIEAYAAFVASPQHAEWLAHQNPAVDDGE